MQTSNAILSRYADKKMLLMCDKQSKDKRSEIRTNAAANVVQIAKNRFRIGAIRWKGKTRCECSLYVLYRNLTCSAEAWTRTFCGQYKGSQNESAVLVRTTPVEYNHTRLLVWLSSRSARSKTLSVLEPCEGILGVFGIVAWAAAPRAALSGVAGTGVLYPPDPCDPTLAVE